MRVFRLLPVASLAFASQSALSGETSTYKYDALGRLTTVTTRGACVGGGEGEQCAINQSVTASFDAADNRVGYNVSGAGTPVVPTGYTASSNAGGYTGLSGIGAAMRDGLFNTSSTIHGTNNTASEWIKMDLGTSVYLASVVLVPAHNSAPGGWGYAYLNGATVERSTDGTTWTSVGTVSSTADDVPVKLTVNAMARYLRVSKTSRLGLGDFVALM